MAMACSSNNVRPIAILAGYMATAAGLTWWSIAIILRQQRIAQTHKPAPLDGSPKKRVWLFAGLAALSLATTWHYMFAFFAHSHREWAAAHAVLVDELGGGLQLGPWLRDTQLFRQAWGSAMETDARFWWTQQIFGFVTVWSVVLGAEGLFCSHLLYGDI